MRAVHAEPSTHHPAAVWRIELLGQLRARSGDRVLTQFGSRKVAALLARLALYPKRAHSREELVDLLWPDADLETGRNRLRQALFALRRLLEPPGAAEVLVVDRSSVRLNGDVFQCDVAEFEAHVRARDAGAARALYTGELLPGHYDDWIADERARLAALADRIATLDEFDAAPRARAPRASDAPGQRIDRGPQAMATVSAAVVVRAATSPARDSGPLDRAELLPAYVARFFGRETEIGQLLPMLDACRLITLLGAGGSGKTRLAVEVARRWRRPGAVVAFVALAECSRPDELPARLRAALRLPGARTEDPGNAVEQLTLCLGARPALLVLDNFEQLVAPGGAAVLEELLQGLPQLHLLVSSRRMLDVEGERGFEVPPLPLPDAGDDLAALAANPSVALFVDRAQGARSGFHLNARNRDDVAALCSALEGVPLALELAASRAHALSVAEMRAQMDERLQSRFAQLARKGPRAARSPRHASLDAAIDWSWQMLTRQDQQNLSALSVFREGFRGDAAAAVWQLPRADEALGRLVADSLVRSELGSDGTLRHRLFEMVREFVADRLDASERLALRARHRAWCLHLARRHVALLPLAEVPNLHEALRTAIDDGQPLQTLELALATESHWERRGVPPEVRGLWLAALDDVCGITPGAAAVHAARCLFARRLYEAGDAATAKVLADEAVAAAGDDISLRVPALAVQLRLRWKSLPRGDDGMSDALREAVALTDGGHNRRTRAELLNLLGEVMVLGRHDASAALPYYDQALALYEALGEQRLAWDVRMGQGICAQVQRRFDDAIAMHTAVADAAERLDDQLLLIDAHNNLAVACNHARRWADAVRHGRTQLRLATRQYSRYMQVMALWNLGRPLARSRQAELAATALAASASTWTRQFGGLSAGDQRYVAKVQRLVRQQVGAARTAELWAEAERMALADAVQAVLGG